jgi:hypothetical protein
VRVDAGLEGSEPFCGRADPSTTTPSAYRSAVPAARPAVGIVAPAAWMPPGNSPA